MNKTMNIFAKKGSKVRFLNENGWDGEPESASRYLDKGKEYTVDFVDIGGWCSSVFLKEVPNIPFNTVMFEDIAGD